MRPLCDRTVVLASLRVAAEDGRVYFPVFRGEEDVPCYFTPAALGRLVDRAMQPEVDPRDVPAVRALLAAFTAPVTARFAWRHGVIEVIDVVGR